MSELNSVVLIQLMMSYAMDEVTGPRTFTFQRNNLMHTHTETEEEVSKRKSILNNATRKKAYSALLDALKRTVYGRVGYVWCDPKMEKLAIPLETATGDSGFGVLPTGSRVEIPEGKFVRAFTYWKRVNDIDLSCFGLTEDGKQEEFSWRNMWNKQGKDITYSGDQTSGYEGGSEYFDIDIDLFRKLHPDMRYIVFCNNVYSGIDFAQCDCKAGFMIREEDPKKVPWWIGERNERPHNLYPVFDPGTVATSFKINAKSTFAYLFAIDLEAREMVWLNIAKAGRQTVAGESRMGWLRKYLHMAEIFSMPDLLRMAGTEVDRPEDADIILTDSSIVSKKAGAEIIHSWDIEKMLKLIAGN